MNYIDYISLLIGFFLIALIDFINLYRSRRIKHIDFSQRGVKSKNYTVLIPIFGDTSYLKNVDFLRRYKDQVVLCTTNKETPKFNNDLNAIAEKEGFRIFKSEVPIASKKHKPNPWRLFHNTLHGSESNESLINQAVRYEINREIARDEIVRDSFSIVKTNYCVFLDGDTYAERDLDQLVGMMELEGHDIASVRVLASKEETLMEKLQAIEYRLAMDGRKIYPWLTSGACMVAKTEVIKEVMSHHSLFFSGGDIEIGKISKILKKDVGHLYFELYTAVPSTFKAWFKQRMAWFGGGFRHCVINMHRYSWKHPLYFLYFTVLVYLMTPLRWYEIIKHPLILPLVIALYWVILYLFHWRDWSRYYFLFPFYALIQITTLVPLGVYTYFKMAFYSRNLGHIKLRHREFRKFSTELNINQIKSTI